MRHLGRFLALVLWLARAAEAAPVPPLLLEISRHPGLTLRGPSGTTAWIEEALAPDGPWIAATNTVLDSGGLASLTLSGEPGIRFYRAVYGASPDGHLAILTPPHSASTIPGTPIRLGVTAVGAGPIRYQWQHEGTNIPAATNATLHIPVASAGEAGEYRVKLTRAGRMATLGSISVGGEAMAVDVADGLAAVAAGTNGLYWIDVRRPEAPELLGHRATLSPAVAVRLEGTRTFVSGHTSFEVFDARDPRNPIRLDALSPIFVMGTYGPISRFGDSLVVLQGGYPAVLNITPSGKIQKISDPFEIWNGGVQFALWDDVAVLGAAYTVKDLKGTVRLVPIEHETDSRRTVTGLGDIIDIPLGRAWGNILALGFQGDILCIAEDSLPSFQTVDFTNPFSPRPLGGLVTSRAVQDIQIAGFLAYLAEGTSGLSVIDMAQTAVPVERGRWDTGGSAHGIRLSGDLAYVANGPAGLAIVDIADRGESVLSPPAHLQVQEGPVVLLEHPKDTTVDLGGDVKLMARAGSGELLYQWQHAGTNIPGMTASTLAISNATRADAGEYRVAVSRPARPRRVGGHDLGGAMLATKVQIGDRIAYVTGPKLLNRKDRLSFFGLTNITTQVLDIGNPSQPVQLGELPGDAYDAVVGSLAFQARFSTNLTVFDVTVPMHPVVLSVQPLLEEGIDLQADGNRIHLLTGSYLSCQVETFDITTPSRPSRSGSFSVWRGSLSLAVSGNAVALTGSNDFDLPVGLYTMAGPGGVKWLGTVPLPTGPPVGPWGVYNPGMWSSGLVLSDRRMFMVGNPNLNESGAGAAYRLFDLSDPAAPKALPDFWRRWKPDGRTWGLGPRELRATIGIRGKRLYLADRTTPSESGLVVLGLDDPSGVLPLGRLAISEPYAVALDRDLAFVTDGSAGLHIIDVSDSGATVFSEAATLTVKESALRILQQPRSVLAAAGSSAGFAVRATGTDELRYQWQRNGTNLPGATNATLTLPHVGRDDAGSYRVAVIQRGRHKILGKKDMFFDWVTGQGGPIQDLAVAGDHAFVALRPMANEFGFRAMDVRNPAKMVEVGRYECGTVNHVKLQGSTAYLATGNNGLLILDVSNPRQPQRVGRYFGTGGCWDFEIIGTRGYLLDDQGVQVLDVSAPSFPRRLGTYPYSAGYLNGSMSLRDGLVCLGTAFSLVDLTEPRSPVLLSDQYKPRVNDSSLSGNLAFLASGPLGLQILDIGNPKAPRLLGEYLPPTGTRYVDDFTFQRVLHADGILYLGHDGGPKGMPVLDVSRPEAPLLLEDLVELGFGDEALPLAVVEDRLLFVRHGHDLVILDRSNPGMVVLSDPAILNVTP